MLIQANALWIPLRDASVHCVVTSPPYWGQRDYKTGTWEGGDPACNHRGCKPRSVSGGPGKQYTNVGSNRVFAGDCMCGARRIDAQLGLESTPEEYVGNLVQVFREVRRALRDDGTVWLNLGDSYAASIKGSGGIGKGTLNCGPRLNAITTERQKTGIRHYEPGLQPKNLVGIPWRVAFALQADGLYLRSDIIWAKPNPMTESVRDRPTKAHEYVFLLAKNARYYYDAEAIKEPAAYPVPPERRSSGDYSAGAGRNDVGLHRSGGFITGKTRNRRTIWRCDPDQDVWDIVRQPYRGAHFATFPEALVTPCVLAGTSPRACGVCGAPWKRVVKKTGPSTYEKLNCSWLEMALAANQRGLNPSRPNSGR